jgi:hypothetical protein
MQTQDSPSLVVKEDGRDVMHGLAVKPLPKPSGNIDCKSGRSRTHSKIDNIIKWTSFSPKFETLNIVNLNALRPDSTSAFTRSFEKLCGQNMDCCTWVIVLKFRTFLRSKIRWCKILIYPHCACAKPFSFCREKVLDESDLYNVTPQYL